MASADIFRQWAQDYSNQYNVPFNEIDALLKSESGYQNIWANDKNGTPIVGGAYGPGQILDSTARDLNINRFDPQQNIEGAVKYYKQLKDKYNGDIGKAILAYKGYAGDFNKGYNDPKLQKVITKAGGTIPTDNQPKSLGQKLLENIGNSQMTAAVNKDNQLGTPFDFSFLDVLKGGAWGALLLLLAAVSLFTGITGLNK